jgi:hypothetical protein
MQFAGATTRLDVSTWEFCNQRWKLDSHRIAQRYQAWVSTSSFHYLSQNVVAYDSTASAVSALSEFRTAASSCSPYRGPLFGNTASGSLALKAQDLPAVIRSQLHGYPSFYVARKVRIDELDGYVVDALIQHQQYVIICSVLREDGAQASVGVGSCLHLSYFALSRL